MMARMGMSGVRQMVAIARRWYSRISPPAPASVIRVSKNNIAYLGPPKEGPKPRQLLVLPPFPDDGSNPLPGRKNYSLTGSRVTAITWVKHYFCDVPSAVIQSHFNKGLVTASLTGQGPASTVIPSRREIKHNEAMEPGMQIHVPVSICEAKISTRYDTIPTATLNPNADEIAYLQRLVTYKDSAIVVLNKPPKMPVKGNLPVHNAMDALAAAALTYGNEEGPKLVHRLDAESSGLLLMSRTKESSTWLHSLCTAGIRDKTRTAWAQKFWALVIGCPKDPEGVIHAPLTKVLLNGGKMERVMLADPFGLEGCREAATEYRMLGPTIQGCSWLELRPLTSLKHQLRVHCAEALRTPIVGDFKYGWCAHLQWKQMRQVDFEPTTGQPYKMRRPEGLAVQKGSVLSKVPLLHLHCREIVLPHVARALRFAPREDGSDLLRFVAPMHPHMQISWNVMSSFLV